jgi:hypothetical protein
MADELTQFDYLLNAFELASQSETPAELHYAEKRRALYDYVRQLESDALMLKYAAEHFVAADFHDQQVPTRTVLKIAVPHGTPVSVDLPQTLKRGWQRERVPTISVREDKE